MDGGFVLLFFVYVCGLIPMFLLVPASSFPPVDVVVLVVGS